MILIPFSLITFKMNVTLNKVHINIAARALKDKMARIPRNKNKNLNFKDLEEKYLKKAMEIENKLFHDISPEKKNFKIVHEVTNNQVYFYYYLAKTYYSAIICRKQKKDKEYDGWIFSGYKPFWFELILNNKVVVWKKYF